MVKHNKKPKPAPAPDKPKGVTKQRAAVVTLRIGARIHKGGSSKGYGHAEMHALRNFILEVEGEDLDPVQELKDARSKTVSCPNQPVCGSCTLILKKLGFKAQGATKFSTAKSGGVSWGSNLKVMAMLKTMGLSGVHSKAMQMGAK